WSEASAQSSYVIDEASRARAAGKLVPVSLSGMEAGPASFRALYTIDLSGWDGDAQDPRFGKLIEELAERVGRAPGGPASPTADKAAPESSSAAHPDPPPRVRQRAKGPAAAAAVLPVRPAALELLSFTLAIAK